MSEKTPITAIPRDTELDFTNDNIRSVWIQSKNPSEVIGVGSLLLAGENEALKNQILSLITGANEVIFIGTTNLSHPEIVEVLLRAVSRGVRVYIHIDSTGFDRLREDATTRSLAGPCLIRERITSGIDCIICDGNEMDAAGLLLATPLDSNLTTENSGWSLQLNKNQIDELERRYTHDFWSGVKGREILSEEEVNAPPMISDKPYSIYPMNNGDVLAMASLCTGDPTSIAAKKIQNAEMKSIIAFDDMPKTPFGSVFFDLISKQSEVIVNSPFTVSGNDQASFFAHSGSQLHAAIGTKVSVIAGWDRSASSTWGSMLILDETQSQDIQKIFDTAKKSPEWFYLKECPVGDLTEEIWFDGKQRKVLNQVNVDLGIIEVSAVNPEIIATDVPDLPRGEGIVRKTNYTWISSPPLAPENAESDSLVTSWVESTNSVATELSGLDERKPKTSMLGFKGKAKDIEKRISAATDLIIGISTKSDLSKLVDEVNEITSLVDETSSGIQKAEQKTLDDKEKEEQKDAWEQLVSKAKNRAIKLGPLLKGKRALLGEMEKGLKKAKDVEEKKISSDIESLTNEISTLAQEHQDAVEMSKNKFEFVPPSKSFKPDGKTKSTKGHKFVGQGHSKPQFKVNIPEEDLPIVGTLLSADDKRYLAISFVEDIPAGTKEAKRLGATLCCPREVVT